MLPAASAPQGKGLRPSDRQNAVHVVAPAVALNADVINVGFIVAFFRAECHTYVHRDFGCFFENIVPIAAEIVGQGGCGFYRIRVEAYRGITRIIAARKFY